MTVVYVICFVILLAAGLMALWRVERGPSMFDRIIGVDVTTAVLVGTVAVIAAATRRTDLVPVLVVLALVGFIAAVSIARFAAAESADEGRILTRGELEQILAERAAQTEDSSDDDDGSGSVIVSVDDEDDDEDDDGEPDAPRRDR